MRKLLVLAVLAFTSLFALADTSVSVSGIRDTRSDNVTGYQVAAVTPVDSDFRLTGKFENTVGQPGTNRDLLAVGAEYDFGKAGSLTLTGTTSVGYLETVGNKGSFVTVGGKASAPVLTGLTAFVGVERQLGTSGVNALDNTEGFVGAEYSLSKALKASVRAGYADGVSGAKYQGGLSYQF